MSSEIIRFPLSLKARAGIQKQACYWIAKLDSGSGSHRETQCHLRQWLEEDRSHLQVFLELAVLWDQLDELESLIWFFSQKQSE